MKFDAAVRQLHVLMGFKLVLLITINELSLLSIVTILLAVNLL